MPPSIASTFTARTFWAVVAPNRLQNVMIRKHLLRPDRLRHIPPSFSWVDHRLIRQARLRPCEARAWALYLFLVCVADVQGLSYYSDASVSRYLNCDGIALSAARQQLLDADLIAYAKPLYQVLALGEELPSTGHATARSSQVRSVGEILRQVMEGGQP
jgi:hypothetical protein